MEAKKEEEQHNPDVKKGGTYWGWIVGIFLFVILLITVGILVNKPPKGKTSNSAINRTENNLPNQYTETYTLSTNNQSSRVNVPAGYTYTVSGGGKKYYHTPQNGTKEIFGDGKYHDVGQNVPYFDLEYFNEDVTVVCNFTKK